MKSAVPSGLLELWRAKRIFWTACSLGWPLGRSRRQAVDIRHAEGSLADQALYSDHDVAVVRFLRRRRAEGMSMAQATGLLDQTWAAGDPEGVPDRLVAALRGFDEPAAEQAFAAAERLLGAEGAALELVPRTVAEVPAEAGGETAVEVEHFASNFLRRQIVRLLCALPLPRGRPLLVGCGPDEQHELGALLLTLLLRARGHRVVHLGARLPCQALERAVAALDPVGVAISHTMPESLEQSVALARRGSALPRRWWGGAATALASELAGRLPVTILPGTVEQGARAIDAALQPRRATGAARP